MARYGGRKRRKNALAVKKNEERKRVGVWYSPDAIMPVLEGGVYPIYHILPSLLGRRSHIRSVFFPSPKFF